MSIYAAGAWAQAPVAFFGPDSTSPTRISNEFVTQRNAVAWSLFGGMRTAADNVVFSPLAVNELVGIAYVGTDDATKAEISAAFKFPDDPTALGADFMRVRTELLSAPSQLSGRIGALRIPDQQAVSLDIANAVWAGVDVALQTDYVRLVRQRFAGDVFRADFGDTATTAQRMNVWAAERSGGRAATIIAPAMLSPDARLVLASVVSVHGHWATPFDPQQTTSTSFTNTRGARKPVEMMQARSTFPYFENELVQLVVLPFQDQRIEMVIVLPKRAFLATERELDADRVHSWRSQAQRKPLRLQMPRFTVDYQGPVEAVLRKLGVRQVFTPEEADLRRLSRSDAVNLSAIMHRTSLSVAEQGTHLDATGFAQPRLEPAIGGRAHRMTVDRPFVFLVRDRVSDLTLVMGRITDPFDRP